MSRVVPCERTEGGREGEGEGEREREGEGGRETERQRDRHDETTSRFSPFCEGP